VCQDEGENTCERGRNIGVARPGGYADHQLVPHPRYLVDVDGLDLSWAATMACSGLTAYSAISKVLPPPSDTPVVVIGVGLTAVATLSARGHRATCAADRSEANLAAARALGATNTVSALADDLSGEVMTAAGGPVNAVIGLVNNSRSASAALDMLAKGGRMVQVGLFGGEVTIATALLAFKFITIQGSYVGTLAELNELNELVALAKTGRYPASPSSTKN
jgi:propanol-preferring alcohol dehydrogenase